ncbi:hypothetical protein TNCV_2893321, partial [Trichonephila clavipes]
GSGGEISGLHIDSRLTFKSTSTIYLRNSGVEFLWPSPLSGGGLPLSLENKVILYKQILRPVITYGSPVWGAAAATHMKKVQVMQNKILRVDERTLFDPARGRVRPRCVFRSTSGLQWICPLPGQMWLHQSSLTRFAAEAATSETPARIAAERRSVEEAGEIGAKASSHIRLLAISKTRLLWRKGESSAEESSVEIASAKSATPVIAQSSPAAKAAESASAPGPSKKDDGFTTVGRNGKRIAPIVIDAQSNATELLTQIGNLCSNSSLQGRFENGKLRVFPTSAEEHRIIKTVPTAFLRSSLPRRRSASIERSRFGARPPSPFCRGVFLIRYILSHSVYAILALHSGPPPDSEDLEKCSRILDTTRVPDNQREPTDCKPTPPGLYGQWHYCG